MEMTVYQVRARLSEIYGYHISVLRMQNLIPETEPKCRDSNKIIHNIMIFCVDRLVTSTRFKPDGAI